MKKILSLTLVLTLLLGSLFAFSASAYDPLPDTKSDDYIYDILDDGTIEIVGYTGNDEVIAIPSEIEGLKVTSIGYKAFLSASAKEVIIPDSVTSIKTSAFRIMRNLESVTIPESVTTIEQYAFEYCESLSSITLPKKLESLGREVLDYTPYFENPENWKNGMLYVGSYLVASDKNLSGVCEIKEGTTLIADHTFSDRPEITGVILPQSLKHIGYECFGRSTALKEITIPEGVITIGDYAFFDCRALESISLPQTLEKIGEGMLDDTAYYKNHDNWQDGVLYAGNALLMSNEGISGEYVIKDGTRIIADSAFSGQHELESIIMPDSVKHIGNMSFGWCSGLQHIKLSQNLTEISDSAFASCTSLANINIPESVTKIGDEAFISCQSLKSVIIPESVTEIGIYAFDFNMDCLKLYGTKDSAAEEYAKKENIPFVEISENYKDKVLELLNISALDFYIEEYEYFSTADEATPDYVLISAYNTWDTHITITKNFGDYILHSTELTPGDGFGYYIYLPDTNEIYTLIDAFDSGLPNVYCLFTDGVLGELTGDVNNDNRLSIQDATLIQKYLAGMEYISDNFPASSYTNLVADFNCDGDVNIRDATAIQKKLAGLLTERVEHTVLDMHRVNSDAPTYNNFRTIANNKAQLTEALLKTSPDATVDEMFTDEYFKENSVIVMADVIGGSCCTQLIDSVILNDSTLKITRFRNYHENCDPDMNYQYVLIEASKDSLRYVTDIEVIDLWALICY